MSTTSAVYSQESTSAAPSTDDSLHIYTVAAKSLQDCVELLRTLKAVMAEEEAPEEEEQEKQRGAQLEQLHQLSTNGTNISNRKQNGDTPAGMSMRDIHHMSRSASQEAEQNPVSQVDGGTTTSSAPKPPRAASALPKAITPCPRSEIYTKPSVLACQGTIGKHVRHLHDHYRLLLSTFPLAQVKKNTTLIHFLKKDTFKMDRACMPVSVHMIFWGFCSSPYGGLDGGHSEVSREEIATGQIPSSGKNTSQPSVYLGRQHHQA